MTTRKNLSAVEAGESDLTTGDLTPLEDVAPEPVPEKSETTLRREAYSEAEGRLKAEFPERFRALVVEAATARGVTYNFRKTEEEKAEEQLRQIIAAHPNLAATLQQQG